MKRRYVSPDLYIYKGENDSSKDEYAASLTDKEASSEPFRCTRSKTLDRPFSNAVICQAKP